MITTNENKLDDLLLSYDMNDKTNDKTNINDDLTNNNTNILIDSKSDIFKTGFSKNEAKNLEKEINNNQNPPSQNKDMKNETKNLMSLSQMKNLSMIKEPNNELLNDILINVDTII